MTDDASTPRAVRALGTIRRDALAAAAARVDAARELLDTLASSLAAFDEAGDPESALRAAIAALREAESELAAYRDPQPRQAADIERVRAAAADDDAR